MQQSEKGLNMNIKQELIDLASVDIFSEAQNEAHFIGRPYYLDYEKAFLLVADSWKNQVGGIPQGAFILAFYENPNDNIEECLLLRAIRPAKLPTDSDVVSSMVEYYKGNLKTSGADSQMDDYTRYTFSFSGLECRILGTFFKGDNGSVQFGADVENYYSAHNYRAYKPTDSILEHIVNFRDGDAIVGGSADIKIGKVRYSSSLRFQEKQEDVPVYVSPQDFLGKRTALFGMTRTGKSNTVKKVIEATTQSSSKAISSILPSSNGAEEILLQFADDGTVKHKVGQIIFDINGEYANANLQDDGTAIFEKYSEITTRYSVLEKPNFKVLKANFYNEIETGFELISNMLSDETGDYIKSFLSVDLKQSANRHDIRQQRKLAAYACCLYKAGFEPQEDIVRFTGNKEINSRIKEGSIVDPKNGVSYDDAISWFTWVAENENSDDYFSNYRRKNGRDWIDEDLRALLVMLTRKRDLKGASVTGFRKLQPLVNYHTKTTDSDFNAEIVAALRRGEIVIIDLSQGDPVIQQTFSEKICRSIFVDSMGRFVSSEPNNFIQFYFEEAHNLFPKKDDKDLSQIYNRIAKEGAKLNLGMIYATQEVSSISSNILKNTQNWFIAHLNNDDELREIRKFYDFGDFCDSLIRYSAGSDRGFIRMKTYSNAFVVPVQIDRFVADNTGTS